MRTIVLGVVAALALALAACEEQHEPCSPTLTVSADPTTISSGDTVDLTIEVTDFTLEEADPTGLAENDWMLRHGDAGGEGCEGHYHVYLDDLMTNPILQDHQTTTSVVVEAEPGDHELIVRLNHPDHKIIEPEIVDSVAITVQ